MSERTNRPVAFDPAAALILNVDDQEHARYAKSRVLRKAGYRVIEATSGQEALDLATHRVPDTIMLDVNLPDINGFDVCRKLKNNPVTAPIPVLQVSASFTSSSDQAEGLEGGADAYLTAPTDPRVLLGTVRAMVRIRFAEKELERLLISERQARKEAERAGRIKDDFLATLSHELRTPLNAVIGWATILGRTANDPQQVSQGVAVIERNARAQSTLIAELLDMNRILAGKTRLDRAPHDLATILHNAVETARPIADAKGITLSFAPAAEECIVDGDQARIQQVVSNLISNALKFTPRDGNVCVRLTRSDDRAEYTVTVTDSGIGISSQFLPYVFDRFRQEDSSTTRSHGGLGLGLAIVKHIIMLHGGRVSAASEGTGKGATFSFTLPAAGSQAPLQPAAPDTAATTVTTETVDLSGLRVLVIDDEPDARDLTSRMLLYYGGRAQAAANAAEALAAQQAAPFDVIVSDIGMPGTDGYSFLRQLRSRGDKTPAVALTAFAREEDEHRAAVSGFDAHIAKPFDPVHLAATVKRLAGH